MNLLKEKTNKNFIQPPFRRPKEKGDYLNKDIMLLDAPENNYK